MGLQSLVEILLLAWVCKNLVQVPCRNTEAWVCKILVVHSRKKCFLLPWYCLLRDFAQFLGCLRQDFLQSLGCHRHYFSSTAHLCQILVIHSRKRCFCCFPGLPSPGFCTVFRLPSPGFCRKPGFWYFTG